MDRPLTIAAIIGSIVAIAIAFLAFQSGSDLEERVSSLESASQRSNAQVSETDAELLDGLPVADFYVERCFSCHGSPRENFTEFLVLADEAYVDIIRFGVPGTLMGASGLTRSEAQLLVEFLRSPLR